MHNIRDWCISRQIWWGHQIPAWTCDTCNEVMVRMEAPEACEDCAGKALTRETDVLDTWFSSALWPFSTMGWPEKAPLLKTFYPTSVLVTGFDILFFWVARMMMMGIHFMKEIPFKDVYVHALVRDEHGKKMIPAISPGYNDRAVRGEENHPACSRKLNGENYPFGSFFAGMIKRTLEGIPVNDDTLAVDNKNCVRCMHCINVMTKALSPGDDKGVSILIGGKRTLKIGDLMGTVIVPFHKLETDEDYEEYGIDKADNKNVVRENPTAAAVAKAWKQAQAATETGEEA